MKTATRPKDLSSRVHGKVSTSTAVTPSKIARLLAGASINRFEAERLSDHCLPSTIAVLANHHGLIFKHQPERVPNRRGKSGTATRYNLPASEHDKARKVLSYLKRIARPTTEG